VDLWTTGNAITRLGLEAPVNCEAKGAVIAVGLFLGQPEMEPFSIPIKGKRKFYFQRKTSIYGKRTTRLVGRVQKDRIVGRWSQTLYDEDSFSTCWTGKSRNDPWVRFSAKRVPAATG